MYDPTAGMIETPDGQGKYVSYDPASGQVTVEMDNEYLVVYDGNECFVMLT